MKEEIFLQYVIVILTAQVIEINTRNEQNNKENNDLLREILYELKQLNKRD